jgi:DNA-binding response OmpR family regulator
MPPDTEILVVDDEPAICALLTDILEQQGFSCKTANTSDSALNLLTQQSFDLVLLDIRMPGMSGMELLEIIHKSYASTPVIMVTAVNDANTAVEAMKKGAADYILKPFALDDVTNRVNEIIRTKLSAALENIPVIDRANLAQSRIEAIAQGVDAQVEHFDFHDRIVTERTIEVARQLNIPENDINRWASARREWMSARSQRMKFANNR